MVRFNKSYLVAIEHHVCAAGNIYSPCYKKKNSYAQPQNTCNDNDVLSLYDAVALKKKLYNLIMLEKSYGSFSENSHVLWQTAYISPFVFVFFLIPPPHMLHRTINTSDSVAIIVRIVYSHHHKRILFPLRVFEIAKFFSMSTFSSVFRLHPLILIRNWCIPFPFHWP